MNSVGNTFKPLAWQVAPFMDKSPVLLLTGSAGGGKSKCAAEKIHAYLLKYNGATGIVGRKDKTAAGKSVVPFLLSNVMGNTDWGRFYKSDGLFRYSNGSELWVVGMSGEDQREALKSIGKDGQVDIAWFEEANALAEDDHNLITTRMRGTAASWGQVIYTTNPDRPSHWINQRLIIGGEAAVYYSKAADNPHNPPSYFVTLDRLTGIMRKRMRDGLWVVAEGAVYDNFDPTIHVKRRNPAEIKFWYMAMDEGYNNPATVLLIGEDNDGRWHVFRVWYERHKLQSQVVDAARHYYQLVSRYGRRVSTIAVDAAAAGLVAELRNASLPAVSAKGGVIQGIKKIQDRLSTQPDGLPRLTIDPRCAAMINEFESYSWKKKPAGISDEPNKEHDHTLDPLRYLEDAKNTSKPVSLGVTTHNYIGAK